MAHEEDPKMSDTEPDKLGLISIIRSSMQNLALSPPRIRGRVPQCTFNDGIAIGSIRVDGRKVALLGHRKV